MRLITCGWTEQLQAGSTRTVNLPREGWSHGHLTVCCSTNVTITITDASQLSTPPTTQPREGGGVLIGPDVRSIVFTLVPAVPAERAYYCLVGE